MPTIRAHSVSIQSYFHLIAVVIHLRKYLSVLILLIRLLLLNLVLGTGSKDIHRSSLLRRELGTHLSNFPLLVSYHLPVTFESTLEIEVFLA
jgi:hypothetical protein